MITKDIVISVSRDETLVVYIVLFEENTEFLWSFAHFGEHGVHNRSTYLTRITFLLPDLQPSHTLRMLLKHWEYTRLFLCADVCPHSELIAVALYCYGGGEVAEY